MPGFGHDLQESRLRDAGEPQPPAPCPRCKRQPLNIPVIYDPNFYGNADRLAALQGGE
jgi:hypothetical protein